MKRILLPALCAIMLTAAASAQILTPVKWSYAAKKTSANTATVFFKATIDAGWHIYSLNLKEGGPIKTSITISPSKDFGLIGKPVEPKPLTRYEKSFSMDVSFFEKEVIFQQKIKLKAGQATVKGKLEFMTCNDQKCLPPDELEFSVPVK